MTVLTFPQPATPLTMNQRLHWSRRARLTRAWRHAAHIHALERRAELRGFGPALVRVTFPVTRNVRRDPHNWAPTVKAIVDGLTDAGVWPDDTADHVAILDPRFDKGAQLVQVALTPMTRPKAST